MKDKTGVNTVKSFDWRVMWCFNHCCNYQGHKILVNHYHLLAKFSFDRNANSTLFSLYQVVIKNIHSFRPYFSCNVRFFGYDTSTTLILLVYYQRISFLNFLRSLILDLSILFQESKECTQIVLLLLVEMVGVSSRMCLYPFYFLQ